MITTPTKETTSSNSRAQAPVLFTREASPAQTASLRPDVVAPVPPPPPSVPSKWPRRLAFGAVVLALITGATTYYTVSIAPYESTDDAFIDGHVISISPQVAGRVVNLLVHDNQAVKKGDVLAEIDSRDFDVKLAQSQAGLAAAHSRLEQAKAEFAVSQAKADQEQSSVAAAEADSTRAQTDLQRYQAVESRAVARSQIDLAEDQAHTTVAQVAVAKNAALAATAQVNLSQAEIKTAEANVQLAEANVRQAELDLSYTKIVATEDGYVTHRSVEEGNYIQIGQLLLALVPRQLWVVANFKETQLTDLRPGQPVNIVVDAYPGHPLKGHVDSIQAGSGAHFSLLPPENATGNYVKVVQRVPVKIVFDEATNPALPLGPGMSVVPVVKVK